MRPTYLDQSSFSVEELLHDGENREFWDCENSVEIAIDYMSYVAK